MQALPVRVPSGSTYWTVLDDELRVVAEADAFLRELRFGRSRAVETTKSYAGGIVLYLRWCRDTRREWRTAARDLGLFMLWLKWNPGGDESVRVVVPGPGSKQVRRESRINKVLTSVRGFLVHAVISKKAPAWVMELLYELGDDRDLPAQARGESEGMRYRLRARHRLQEPETAVDRASDQEIVAMFGACRSARDRLIVLLLGRAGLRRGQAAGLRRSDMHLLMDSRALGCAVEGAHVHVVRRENPNRAYSKSRKAFVLPVDFLVVQALDLYMMERHDVLGSGGSDFLLVNLFRQPLGSPVTPEACRSEADRQACDGAASTHP
ncbi:site-specific integrase [Streptomyces caniferus]|uniref:Tyr recombinase domain-containing protein n=2 Tax=Streptomyces caniferus TaxID=285557 RepID=A0A640SLM7_9ACTN|nr:site-specific integrase [Streptomyces caniferus]GFE11890.1 hypothetical protein Scani_81580 [Streptomyces caniferus]